MSLYLVHHVDALTAEQDPRRPISESGRHEADRLGDRFLSIGVLPERILHSEKQWTIDTAQRIADRLGVPERAAMAHYSINTGDPIAPFLAEVEATGGDLMMCRKESSSSHALSIIMLPPWYTALSTHVRNTLGHSSRPFCSSTYSSG